MEASGSRHGERTGRKSWRGLAWGLFRLTHPFPVAMNALAAGLFAVIVQRGLASPPRVAALMGSVWAVHSTIGVINDYRDLSLDARHKPWKPLVRGSVPRALVPGLAVGLAVMALGLAASNGWASLGLALLVLGAGLWYDLAAKGTAWSWVPYLVAIPTLPVWASVTVGRFSPAILLAYPLGALLALGLYVSNTLPDLEDDAAFGVWGAAHRWGHELALRLAFGSLGGALVLVGALAPLLGNDWRVLAPGLAAGLVVLAVMAARYRLRPSRDTLNRNWPLSIALSLVVAVAWLASLPA